MTWLVLRALLGLRLASRTLAMPLGIHPDLKSRLIEALQTGLPKILVQNGMFLDRLTSFLGLYAAEDALPDHGSIRNNLLRYVGETPLIDFVTDVLATELLKLDRYTSEVASQRLVEISEYSNVDALAARLAEELDSLPWKYLFSFELPNEIATFLKEVITTDLRLGPNFKIVPSTPDLNTSMPLNAPEEKWHNRIHGGTLLFPTATDVKWLSYGIILQMEAEGFVGPYGGAATATAIEGALKSFFGLGIALRLFQVRADYSLAEPKYGFYVHKLTDDKWIIDNKVSLNTDTARVINDLHLNSMITDAETQDRKTGLGNLILKEIGAGFSAGKKGDPLLLASRWLFDSYSRKDGLLNYVQAIVVLEILLGDKAVSDELGLGQLFRNRCAYMIASDHADRAKLMKDFDEIYRVRSQIVHRGKPDLTNDERRLYRTLQNLCNRVIQKEVDLLRAEKESR